MKFFVFSFLAFLFIVDSAIPAQSQKKQKPFNVETAKADWKKYRKDPKKYYYTEINWKVRVYFKFQNESQMEINGEQKFGCTVRPYTYDENQNPVRVTWQEAAQGGAPFDSFAQDDWVMLHGRFVGVSDDGKLIIIPMGIKDLGPQE